MGVENSSSVHIDNNKKDTIVLGEGSTQGLEDTTITAKAKYCINSTKSRNSFAEVCSIMEETVFYLLVSQKYINSKQ